MSADPREHAAMAMTLAKALAKARTQSQSTAAPPSKVTS